MNPSVRHRTTALLTAAVAACLVLDGTTAVADGPDHCCGACSPYGNGVDGDVVCDGVCVLSRDMNYHSLTIAPGAILDTQGHVVRVCGTLANYGTITDRASGGHGEVGGEGGLGADPKQNSDLPDCGDRQQQCTDGEPGLYGGAPNVPHAGWGGHGGQGGAGGGGAWWEVSGVDVDADGGNGGDGGTGGDGGGYVLIYAYILDNQGTIHADGQDGEPGAGAPDAYDQCGAQYYAWPEQNPQHDLAGGGGGGGTGGNGGDGGTVEVYYAHLLNHGDIHAGGGSGGDGGSGGSQGSCCQYGAAGGHQDGCSAGAAGGRGAHEQGDCAADGEPGGTGAPGADGQWSLTQLNCPTLCSGAIIDLNLGGPTSTAAAINSWGQIVGWAENTGGVRHPFLYLPHPAYGLPEGTNDLFAPGSPDQGSAIDINDSGQIIGTPDDPNDTFLWLPEDEPNCGFSAGLNYPYWGVRVQAINNNFQIVGSYDGPDGDQAFFWQCEEDCNLPVDITMLQPPPSCGLEWAWTRAVDINDSGTVLGFGELSPLRYWILAAWVRGCSPQGWYCVGWLEPTGINNLDVVVGVDWLDDEACRCVADEGGDWNCEVLPSLGGSESAANAINDYDEIVGWALTAEGQQHACLWQNGNVYDLNCDLSVEDALLWELVEATDINLRGRIVGWGYYYGDNPAGDVRAFRLTPSCYGDINHDGQVDLADLASLLAVYGCCAPEPCYDPRADLDPDGCIGLADLAELLAHYGCSREQ